MITFNIKEILTNAEDNDEITEDVKEELDKFKKVELKKLQVIKMSTYYSVFLKIKVDDKTTIKQYLKIEKEIKRKLKSKNREIRFIDIEPV